MNQLSQSTNKSQRNDDMYSTGDVIHDHAFIRPDGSKIRLSELASGPIILIFYRHLM